MIYSIKTLNNTQPVVPLKPPTGERAGVCNAG